MVERAAMLTLLASLAACASGSGSAGPQGPASPSAGGVPGQLKLGDYGVSATLAARLPKPVEQVGALGLRLHGGGHYPTTLCYLRNALTRGRAALSAAARAVCHFESSTLAAGETYALEAGGKRLTMKLVDQGGGKFGAFVCVAGAPAVRLSGLTRAGGDFVAEGELPGPGARYAMEGTFASSGGRRQITARLVVNASEGRISDRVAMSLAADGATSLVAAASRGPFGEETLDDFGAVRTDGKLGVVLYRQGEKDFGNGNKRPVRISRLPFDETGQTTENGVIADPKVGPGGKLYPTATDVPLTLDDSYKPSPLGDGFACDEGKALPDGGLGSAHDDCERLIVPFTPMTCSGADFVAPKPATDFTDDQRSTDFDVLPLPSLD